MFAFRQHCVIMGSLVPSSLKPAYGLGHELCKRLNRKDTYGRKRNKDPLPRSDDDSLLNYRLTLKVEAVGKADDNDYSSAAAIIRARICSIRDLNLAKSKAAEQSQLPPAFPEQQPPLSSIAPSHANFDDRSVAGSVLTLGTN